MEFSTRLRCPDWTSTLLLFALTAMLSLVASTGSLGAEERRALVIGNASYGKADLANPVNDAKAVAKALKKVGFKVTLEKNLKKKGIRKAVKTFADSLHGGDVALFFYAGHGVELAGENYLLGVNFSADNEVDAEDDAYKMGTMLKHLSRRNGGLNIVIIDACRDDPYTRSWGRTSKGRGLAVMERIPAGTYIAFSAKPGQIAADGAGSSNSPFTKSLIRHLSIPGIELSELFLKVRLDVLAATSKKQFPMAWDERLVKFFFKPATKTAAPASSIPVVVVAAAETPKKYSEHGIEWSWSGPSGLYFAKTETTLSQYRACVKAGKCDAKNHKTKSDINYCNWGHSGRGEHPMNCVDWYGAQEYCEWAGGRLPTEDEWYAEASNGGNREWAGGRLSTLPEGLAELSTLPEGLAELPTVDEGYAEASNGGNREYAWGDREVDCDLVVWGDGPRTDGCGKDHTWPVCSKEAGNSVSGLCDVTGNVWEWTSTWYDSDRVKRVLRGGSWVSSGPRYLRASNRFGGRPGYRGVDYGFRCVRSSR